MFLSTTLTKRLNSIAIHVCLFFGSDQEGTLRMLFFDLFDKCVRNN